MRPAAIFSLIFSPIFSRIFAVFFLLASAMPVQAQMASLVADRVQVLGNSNLVAQGNVVVVFENVRLSASRISYDRNTAQLSIEGPIIITDGSGTILIAEAAQLSSDLRTGILQSARLVLENQLQIAAAEINRVGGRYTQLTKTVASSCQVCASNPVPLWSIRASRVIHDQETRQLYFHNAQFRIMDIPVFYLPRLRLPDPSVRRATGFLPPELRTSNKIGIGLRLPYFVRLGDHADLTFTPFLSAKTSTFEVRYRQLFTAGEIFFEGAASHDSLLPGQTRYFLFGNGAFDLPLDLRLSFNIEQVSDVGYLSDYSFSGSDRLRNRISLTRTQRNQYLFAEIGRWETLRASELPIADQLPGVQGDLLFEQRLQPNMIGGEIRLRFSAQGHYRNSMLDALGRDQTRLGVAADWQRDWVLANGMIASAETSLALDRFTIKDDIAFAPTQLRSTQAAAISLAWPMARQAANGATDVLEPVVQLAWGNQNGPDAPNEDSLMVDFDMANLFELSRFPGLDAAEVGLRANIGATWTRHNPNGLSFTLAAGKVFRFADKGQFSAASGLDGSSSDWLIAGQAQVTDRLFVQSRALIADDFSPTKAETLAQWQGERLSLAGGHVWVIADTAENRPEAIHEARFDTSYRFNDFWAANLSGHFDLVMGVATGAKLGLEYRNECVTLDLSLSRRFTSSGSVTPTTDIKFGVILTGFGGGGGGPTRRCSG